MPFPLSSNTRMGMMFALYDTPAIPTLLFASAATTPHTCVPCPLKSPTSEELLPIAEVRLTPSAFFVETKSHA